MINFISNFRLLTVCARDNKATQQDWPTSARIRPKNIIEAWISDLESGDEDACNIGILCGLDVVVIDVDPRNGGVESINALFGWHEGAWPETFRVRTPNGGVHLYFQGHPAKKFVLCKGVDYQGVGAMVVAPPSIRPMGCYKIEHRVPVAPLDSRVIAILDERAKAPAKANQSSDFMGDYPREFLLSSLDVLVGVELCREDWVAVGMALKNEGFSYDVWDKLNSTQPKYTPDSNAKRWDSFTGSGRTGRTITDIAKRFGWIPPVFLHSYRDVPIEVDIKKEAPIKEVEPQTSFRLPSQIEGICKYIMDGSETKSKHFSVASALNLLSVLCAGIYSTPYRNGGLTNYCCIVSPAGSGKAHYTNFPVTYLDAQFPSLVAKRPASRQAIHRMLATEPLRHFCFDEFGKFLKSALGPKASQASQEIAEAFLSCWSTPAKLDGIATKAIENESDTIAHPLISMIGGCTPESLDGVLRLSDFAEEGLFSRFDFVFLTQHEQGDCVEDKPECPPEVLSMLQRIAMPLAKKHADKQAILREYSTRVALSWTPEAKAYWFDLRKRCKDKATLVTKDSSMLASAWIRLAEKALRTATLLALAANRSTVELDDLIFAERWHAELVEQIASRATICDAVSDHERICKSIMQALLSLGGAASRAEMRLTNIGALRGALPREVNEALADLVESGAIVATIVGRRQMLAIGSVDRGSVNSAKSC